MLLKNPTLLFKWWWRYTTEEGALWQRVITSIHNEDIIALQTPTLSQVPGPQRDIKRLAQDEPSVARMLHQHLRVQVGHGKKTRFW